MKMNSKYFASSIAAFLIVALTAVYWNHFDNGFHFDDSHTIVNNGYIKDIGNIPLIFQDSFDQSVRSLQHLVCVLYFLYSVIIQR